MISPSTRRRALTLAIVGCLLPIGIGGCNNDESGPAAPDVPEPGLQPTDFARAQDCRVCHPKHFEEWAGSMHAYAVHDPVWHEVRRIAQSQYINAMDQACDQCHSVVGTRTRDIPWGPFALEDISDQSREGVGCDMCHVITGIARLSSAGVTLTPGHTKYGTIRDPIATDAHRSEFNPLYSNSEYCGACHDFVTDGGLELERTFREWREAGFYVTKKTCNDCHMPAYTGRATPSGPERTLHRHSMVGADIALIEFPGKPEQFQLVTAMLKDAISIDMAAPQTVDAGERVDFEVRLTNDKTGHDVPSGVPFNRQVWLSIIASVGQDTIYQSGQLDANGDLMDGSSAFPERDPDLFNAQATMLRADSVPTGFTWDAVYLRNPSIKPGETRRVGYGFGVPSGTTGTLTVEATLRFRSFPPYVFRALGLDSLLPIPIFDMAQATQQIAVD